MKCQMCEVEFEAKRRDAKYCSKKCAKRAERGVGRDVADKVVADVAVNQGVLVATNVAERDCGLCNKKYVADDAFLASCLEDEEGGFRALADNRRCAHRAKWILNHHTLKELEDYNLKGNRIFIPNWKRKEVHGDFNKDETNN